MKKTNAVLVFSLAFFFTGTIAVMAQDAVMPVSAETEVIKQAPLTEEVVGEVVEEIETIVEELVDPAANDDNVNAPEPNTTKEEEEENTVTPQSIGN